MIIERLYEYQYPVWENGQIIYQQGTFTTVIAYSEQTIIYKVFEVEDK